MESRLQDLAERQWRDYRSRQPGTCFADPDLALSLAEAYALQDAVVGLRLAAGDRLAGYKVGCTGPGTVQQFGMRGPIRGCLFASEVRENDAGLAFDAFASLAIEGEMAVRIGSDGAIAAAFPVIELHHFVYRGPRPTLVELVANNGINAGFVLPHEGWLTPGRLIGERGLLSVLINDSLVASGELWPLPGGAEASLDWLRGQLSATGLDLEPGHIVLTGTPLGLYPVSRGDRIAVQVDGEPGASCTVL